MTHGMNTTWWQAIDFQWADVTSVLERNYFNVTAALVALEGQMPPQEPPIGTAYHPSRRIEFPWAFMVQQPYRKEEQEDVVLEAGPGRTLLQWMLSDYVKEVVSLESQECCDWCQKQLVEGKQASNIRPVVGDITCLEFPDNTFDKVFCISTMEHVTREKFQTGMDELVRVTKPGGTLAVTMDIVLGKAEPPVCGSQVRIPDLLELARRYNFAIPPYPPHMFVMQNDTCLLTIGLLYMKKGWKVGDWTTCEEG